MKPGPSPKYDRDAVLDAAMEVFWVRGYADTKLSEILDRTGIGRQSLYSGFGDKNALFLAALERYIGAVLDPRAKTLESDRSVDGLGGVRQVIEDWKLGVSFPDRRGCLVANTSAEVGRRGDRDVEALISAGRQRVEDAFIRSFERAKDLRGISATSDPIGLARVTMMTADGLSSAVKTTSNYAAYGKSALDQLMRFIESA